MNFVSLILKKVPNRMNLQKILARRKEQWQEKGKEELAKRREYKRKNRERINLMQRERYKRDKQKQVGDLE